MVIKRQKYIQRIFFVIYIFINAVLLYFHEPWRDEAQTWLIARDVPLLSIPGYMSYEGHPCLWHLIIVFFAKLNMPYLVQSIIAYGFVAIAVWGLLYYSKLSLYLKIILLASPVLTYYYPVIARSYCLIPLLLFLVAHFYKGRNEYPVRYTLAIAVLVQTNVIMIFPAFLICVCFLAEVISNYISKRDAKKLLKSGVALTLPLISAVLLGCQMLDIEKNSEFEIKFFGIRELLEAVLNKIWSAISDLCGINKLSFCVILLMLLVFLWVTCTYSHSVEKWTVFVVITGTIIGQFIFYAVFYHFSVQRLLVIPLMFAWGIWILRESFSDMPIKIFEIVFGAFVCIILLRQIPAMQEDIKKPYSGSKEASIFIRENIPEDAILIGDNKPECSAIMPYLEQKYYLYASSGEKASYTKWEDGWDDVIEYSQFIAWINELDIGDKEVWLISSKNDSYIEGIEQIINDYQMYFESSEPSIQKEDYRIYRLR